MSDKREIKFRAWDAEQNKMIKTFDSEYQIRVNEEDGTIYCGGYMPNGDWQEPILMQYTGLKDKNGVEIYADDLLEDVNGELIRVYQVDGGFIVKAKYWSANCKDLTWDDELIYQPLADIQTKQYIQQNTIIVGNIYENKDLLT